jgi:3-dehydroquinate dehydratase-2
MTIKIVALNGPNLNRLGKRRPERYGTATLQDVVDGLTAFGKQLDVDIHHLQSNHEGELIDFMHANMDADGVLVNPAGLTLYGRPLLDAVGDLQKPIAIVHIAQLYKIGDIYGPETKDYWKAIGDVYVCGLGIHGYNAALLRLVELITGRAGEFKIVPAIASSQPQSAEKVR